MLKGRQIFHWHKWLGLISGFLLLIISVTGSILVYHHEIDELTLPQEAQISEPSSIDYDAGLKNLLELYPDYSFRIYHEDDQHVKPVKYDLRGRGEKRFAYVHPATGEILLDIDRDKIVSRWLLKLHYTLFIGLWGNFLLFLLGISLILSMFTGVWVYRKHFVSVLTFRAKFLTRNKRLFFSSLHRYVGVWSILLNLVLVVTGLVLHYNIIKAGLSSSATNINTKTAMATSLSEVIEKQQKDYKDFKAAFTILPGNRSKDIYIYGRFESTPSIFAPYSDILSYSPATGNLNDVILVEEKALSDKLYATVTPLHFGNFAGEVSKLLYCILGLAPGILSVTGFLLYLKRK